MARHRDRAGSLSEAIDHFGKVTRSYRAGLFHCWLLLGFGVVNWLTRPNR
jgi:hypothetical protein